MTVLESVSMIDRLKPNRFGGAEKFRWLSDIDGLISRELLATHEGGPTMAFEPYIEGRDEDRALIAPFPYDTLYRWYLESQIDLNNGEIAKYNNARNLFNSAYLTYTDWYNRTHRPIPCGGLKFTEERAPSTTGG